MKLSELRGLFRENFVAKVQADITIVMSDKICKYDIAVFMKQNLLYNFVVIDDLSDTSVKSFDEFIQIKNTRKGLSAAEEDRAIRLLNS